MNMIVGKKQIILASLVVALGAAVYLNYRFANTGEDFLTSATSTTVTAEDNKEENYGDTQFVDKKEVATANDSSEYFSQAKLTRSKTRDEAVSALKVMLEDSALDNEQKTELTMQATELAQSIEVEGKIENLIKAKGFQECMVYCDNEKVDVIVKADDLLDNEVLQIRDIVLEQTEVPVENISIVPVK